MTMTTTLSINKNIKSSKIVICGAGPAGLGAALAFFNNGFTNIEIYEKRADISSQDIEESYPIGVNTRGKRALKHLVGVHENLGDTVASWNIYVTPYSINVASFKSGTVASTTRSIVVNVLLKHVQEKGIPIYYSHAVTNADSSKRTVTFDTKNGIKSIMCDCLVVADGYKSRARQALQQQESSTLQVRQWSWPLTFRVLVSDKKEAQELDPSIHYIFNSIYAAELRDGRWAVVTACQSEQEAFLLSNQATETNLEKLEAYLKNKAPMVKDMFSDEELHKYFSRASFAGAVTWVSELVVDGWALLIGDAAHSTFPATGEGVNASLEDAYVLSQVMEKAQDSASMQDILSTFQKERLADSQALSTIAYSAIRPSKLQILQKLALKASCGLLSGSKRLGTNPIQELLFGPLSAETITPYSEIVNEWQEQLKYVGGRPQLPLDGDKYQDY
eukprot:CAMPEP_0202486234 /NCGR_PEP_ID=MMETSP1361-20130828/4850_1 /ASSEMBLY_ACC=CAM_ASM_000849 /TAXON_ID=210615 /ORGANISM="Staurosira complex sp., Strain CCMP2646" /LENGTH=446 /DNA_ID=CAMNT_0049115309 /DNA_START=102 /DNA_END=1442 /DNA_ORIENTATION=+